MSHTGAAEPDSHTAQETQRQVLLLREGYEPSALLDDVGMGLAHRRETTCEGRA